MKVRFNKKWLTVSRLNRLETFFRKPSCDFFFLLVVILLLCYCRSTESDALLIQLIPSLRSHRGTSYLFYSSQNAQNARDCTRLHSTQGEWSTLWIMLVVSRTCVRRTREIYIYFISRNLRLRINFSSTILLHIEKKNILLIDSLKLHSNYYVKHDTGNSVIINFLLILQIYT